MMWVRETGVIPAALAGMLAGMGVKHADIIASVTFMAIMLTILLQASTTAWMARKLGMVLDTGKWQTIKDRAAASGLCPLLLVKLRARKRPYESLQRPFAVKGLIFDWITDWRWLNQAFKGRT